jgi:hypothetical protein
MGESAIPPIFDEMGFLPCFANQTKDFARNIRCFDLDSRSQLRQAQVFFAAVCRVTTSVTRAPFAAARFISAAARLSPSFRFWTGRRARFATKSSSKSKDNENYDPKDHSVRPLPDVLTP